MNTIVNDDSVVEKKIGKRMLSMRESHKLPSYYLQYPLYDRALPRICKEIVKLDGYLKFIDVGANIGDTVSLVTDEVQGSFLCIDGDKEYLPFLKTNAKKFKDSKIFIEDSYCASNSKNGNNFEIERVNGTAKIVSSEKENDLLNAQFKTLDTILEEHPLFKDANILKIDTDGFEINVLNGGEKFLNTAMPVLYFEFTPGAYLNNKQEPMAIFDILEKNGYEEAMFYDNFGVPVEFIKSSDRENIKSLMDRIDNNKIYYYDILSFHKSKRDKYANLIDKELFASLTVLNNKTSALNNDLGALNNELLLINSKLSLTEGMLRGVTAELEGVYASHEWKIGTRLQRIIVIIMPRESFRRKIFIKSYKILKKYF